MDLVWSRAGGESRRILSRNRKKNSKGGPREQCHPFKWSQKKDEILFHRGEILFEFFGIKFPHPVVL